MSGPNHNQADPACPHGVPWDRFCGECMSDEQARGDGPASGDRVDLDAIEARAKRASGLRYVAVPREDMTALVAEVRWLRGQVERVEALVAPQWRSLGYGRNDLIDDIRAALEPKP